MSSFRSVDEQLAIITRGTAHIEKLDDLRKKLERSHATNTPLRVKLGIDPTGFDVHLGHTVVLRKLRQFQELGHKPVLIIGNATAAVGDPSGRDSSRSGLTPDQIEKNAQTYLTQIAKVIDINKVEVRPNGDWFSKFGFAEMLRLLGHMTVQQMLAREDFRNRYTAVPSVPIFLHELLYPLMQGWDSVEIRADVELGGTEQLYNLMVGRDLQRAQGQEPQICLTMPILRGTDGVKKMGKSVGNYIGLNEPAEEIWGKTMRIPDELMTEWFVLLTDRTHDEINTILAGRPDEAKKTLAADIVTAYHGADAATAARENWRIRNQEKGDPAVIPDVAVSSALLQADGTVSAVDLLVETKLAASKGEARRHLNVNGGFNYGPDRTRVTDPKATVPVTDGLVIRLGRKILRVKLT